MKKIIPLSLAASLLLATQAVAAVQSLSVKDPVTGYDCYTHPKFGTYCDPATGPDEGAREGKH